MDYIDYSNPIENNEIQTILYKGNNQSNLQDDYIDFNDVQDHFGLPVPSRGNYSFSYFGAPSQDIVNNFRLEDYMPQLPTQQTSQHNPLTAPSNGTALALPKLMEAIQKNLGKPYGWGSRGHKKTVDCSGFVSDVLDDMGIRASGTSSTFYNNMVDRFTDPKQAKPGDLIFYTFKAGSNQRFRNGSFRPHGTPNHIAIVLEVNGPYVKVAESSGGSGSAIHWHKMFDGEGAAPGKVYANYSPSNSKQKTEFLGFGRLNKDKVAAYINRGTQKKG